MYPQCLTPPQVGDSGYVGQGSVHPCGRNSQASKGNVDPAPWMVAGEIPSRTGQPPQTLTHTEVGDEFKTPTSGVSRVSRKSGSFRLIPGVYST